jgi:amino-acid N-acetyltransferase
MNIIIKLADKLDINTIINLLRENKLPSDDLEESSVKLFTAKNEDEIIGAIGLEQYGSVGLLRSLVVRDGYKNQKLGEKLVNYLLDFCSSEMIEELFLLTTTADKYFLRFGFQDFERNNVPNEIAMTKEFKDICPSSSLVMHKNYLRGKIY